MATKPRITVTGGAGYIGSITCNHLLRLGFDLQIIDNLSTGTRYALQKLSEARICIGDVRDEAFLIRQLNGFKPHAILHFAAKAYVGESITLPLEYFDNNVVGSISLVKAAISTGVRNIVFSSTCAVYGSPRFVPVDEQSEVAPVSPYGWTKLTTEQFLDGLARSKEVNAIALRYFNAAGASDDHELGEIHDPETHLIPLALRATMQDGEPLKIFGVDYPTEDGSCERDFLHVQDLATAHQLAVERLCGLNSIGFFKALNLGLGKPYSVFQIIDLVERITGRRVNREVTNRREGDAVSIFSNAASSQQFLAWKPQRDLESMISSAYKFELRHRGLI